MRSTFRVVVGIVALILCATPCLSQQRGSSPTAWPSDSRPPEPPKLDVSGYHNKTLDAAYAGTSDAQKLDIYLPEAGDKPFPVIVYVHGGGDAFNTPENMNTIFDFLGRHLK